MYTGDGRVNEHVGLMAMHTAFAREHNRIEEELHKLNPHWDGTRLFQESRRILIGEWQHLVYNEYLSIIFGPLITQQYGLNLHASGYHNGKESVFPKFPHTCIDHSSSHFVHDGKYIEQ